MSVVDEYMNPERATWLMTRIGETNAWIAATLEEIEVEQRFLAPGDPDDDWDYDYNICQQRQASRAREVVASMERELNVAHTNSQSLRKPDPQ